MNQHNLLDLKNDLVFKMFFSRPKNLPLLISFLETIIEPEAPIDTVEILNPTLSTEVIGDKVSVLDLLIRLNNGSRIDVEMQMENTDGFRRRILYYWAKLHQSQLQAGETYQKLSPTISISILNYNEFKENLDEIHSIFELRERQRGTLYVPDLQLHFLELTKYKLWKTKSVNTKDQATLQKVKLLDCWTRFFQLNKSTDQELADITKEPIMNKAYKALEELSMEPSARELAELRERSRINMIIITSETEARVKAEGKAEGVAEGKAEGIAEGKAEGLTEGTARAQRDIIQKMHQSGMNEQQIALILGMNINEIQTLLQKT